MLFSDWLREPLSILSADFELLYKQRAAGVVVSCKIPILATRVRFPGGAQVLAFCPCTI